MATSGIFVPFRGFDREVGPVGTIYLDMEDVGDGTGGTVRITLSIRREMFGFHAIVVPTRISATDALVTAEVVIMRWLATGNERVNGDMDQAVLSLQQAGPTNVAIFDALGFILETQSDGDVIAARMDWATNTTALTYHYHFWGVLYDAEALARSKGRGKGADLLLSGMR